MLTEEKRAWVERAFANDPRRKPTPPSATELLDWLEERALAVLDVRRTAEPQTTWELVRAAEGKREWLAKLPSDTSWASLGGGMWRKKAGLGHLVVHFGGLADALKRADRAIASASWVANARSALAKRDTAALAFAVMMAERCLHDPNAERTERARREQARRAAPRGGQNRGKSLRDRDAELIRNAVAVAQRRPAWSVSEIARQLEKARHGKPGWRRIAAIIAPAVADARRS